MNATNETNFSSLPLLNWHLIDIFHPHSLHNFIESQRQLASFPRVVVIVVANEFSLAKAFVAIEREQLEMCQSRRNLATTTGQTRNKEWSVGESFQHMFVWTCVCLL